MKRITLILTIILTMSISSVAYAYNFPHSFWAPNTAYIDACNVNDYNGIIKYGEESIEIMKNAPEGAEKRNIMISRHDTVGNAYAQLGNYEKSAEHYRSVLNYADENDPQYGGTVVGAKSRLEQFEPRLQVYADNGRGVYYGAKNEKPNGILFGICSDGKTRDEIPNESMVLTYQELGYPLIAHNKNVIKEASEDGLAVEFALNCPREATDIYNIYSLESSLREISGLFGEYPDVPVYLRFGAEFNVWTSIADAQSFKNAFIYVADYFHSRNSNVAMVWSPTVTSPWGFDLDSYYPGDTYVDWVGVSLYSSKYFNGNPNSNEFDEIFFKSGVNSDTVITMENIIKTYGDRKPIMLSESGFGHKLISNGEKMTDFALERMRETYLYLPIVYPEIKLIAHFDAYAGDVYDYRLSTDNAVRSEYLKLTRGRRFIQDIYTNNVETVYSPVENGTWVEPVFEVACYAHRYKETVTGVTYFIDGKYMGMSDTMPFTTYIDASGFNGSHTLTTSVAFSSGAVMTSDSVINIMPSTDIDVKISGNMVEFSREPVMYKDRVMVPMRKIFEELGAIVEWDGNTKTVTATSRRATVRVTVGEGRMYVNDIPYDLDAAPFILDGSTLVPARAISEGLGCKVDWDNTNKCVLITP